MLRRICRVTVLCTCVVSGVARVEAADAAPLAPGSTLCLHSIGLPLPEQDGEARRASLNKRLQDALTAAAFAVPEPQAVSDLIERVEKDTGGFIDVATGQRDQARYQIFQQQRAAALRNAFGCDAEMTAYVVRVKARFDGASAIWDGTSDSVSSTGRLVLAAVAGVRESGWVAALSLWLHAFDLEGNDLAFRSAGIETLVSLAVLKDQDILPDDLWLTNAEKLDAAIRSALGPNGDALRQRGTPHGLTKAPPAPPAPYDRFRSLPGRPTPSDRP